MGASGYDIGASLSSSAPGGAASSGNTGPVNVTANQSGISVGLIAVIMAASIILLLVWKRNS